MRLQLIFIMLLSGMAVKCSFGGVDSNETQYFAGLLLLESQGGLSITEKAQKFQELESITGITTARAKVLLASYRDKPVEWRILCDSMISLIGKLPARPSAPEPKAVVHLQPPKPRR